jgi:uracil-DNA glycosylase family protein
MPEVKRAARPITPSENPFVPAEASWQDVQQAALKCKACPLWEHATQTVFGEGRTTVRMMLVGEQPGNDEDLSGRPFVGPAGKLLDRALEQAGIDRKQTYVTNVVKHFKFEPRGKRRIHAKPSSLEISICLPWLEAELAIVRPKVLVCLGATAAQALLGKQFRITRDRGVLVPSTLAPHVIATIHPSAILRAPDAEAREKETARFIQDLSVVTPLMRPA